MNDLNPDARPEPLLVDQHEGQYVRIMRGKVPAITLDMPEGFRRGTHIRLEVEARVTNVGYLEGAGKEKDELVRHHTFAIEEVSLAGSMTADEADPGVGGSAGREVTEIDDFGPTIQDCVFDKMQLAVLHRGGCDACYPRLPDGVLDATVRELATPFQPPVPVGAEDPGF